MVLDYEPTYTDKIAISKSDKTKILNECSELFLKSNPSMKGYKLTYGFMVHKIVEYYLK
jgi:hypothetical protein